MAKTLHSLGFSVQGSDQSASETVLDLESLGIKVFVGHKAEQVEGATAVVHSTAIKQDNPEITEGLSKRDSRHEKSRDARRYYAT